LNPIVALKMIFERLLLLNVMHVKCAKDYTCI
jgi:hypothetical protein